MGVSTSISLTNGMTPALQSMTRALNMTISSFQSMQNVSSQAVDVTSINAARQALAEAEVHINNYGGGLSQAGRRQTEFNQEIDRGANSANGLMNKIKGAVLAYATIRSVSSALSLSDELTATTARLNMMNDGLQTTDELQKMIYASAEKSRGSYQATADAVSKLGLMAGEAFGSTAEIVGFSEQLNKQFTIAGTTTAGIDAAMLQLTQAMGSGVLRGEEYNSILEQAPNIIQSIADYMDVPKGKLKDMAAQGEITAEIVKNAMFAAADETNEKFESMPKTFAQIWQSFKNTALMAFQPVLQRLNTFANSEAFQNFVKSAILAVSIVAGAIVDIFNLISKIGTAVYNNWSIISPMVYGAITALGLYTAALFANSVMQGISSVASFIAEIQAYKNATAVLANTAAYSAEAVATAQATVAQAGFNAALLASPITWYILIIIALIAVFYFVIAVINKFAKTSISATGIVTGVFAALGAFISNTFIVVWNAIVIFTNFLANVFKDPVAAAQVIFYDFANNVIGYVLKIAEAIEALLNKIPGVEIDITTGISKFYKEVEAASQKVKDASEWEEVIKTKDFVNIEDWAGKGYEFGQGVDDAVKNFNPTNLFNGVDSKDLFSSATDTIDDIGVDTGSISDSMEISKEDLKYMRDAAEREVVNRFTTAQIAVDFKNTANINSNMDIDGVMNQFTEKLREAVDTSAEAVHYVV